MQHIRRIKDIVRHPKMAKNLGEYLVNDLNAILGKYAYPHRILFIAGMPKSGTTWLSSMLTKVPGYNLRQIHDPQGVTQEHDICDEVFSKVPGYGYSVIKLHTHYSPQNFEIITRHVNKFVVMYRDLRDMCVSRYHHVKAETKHRHHRMYKEESLEQGMAHSIDIIGEYYIDWVTGWREQIRKHPDMILPVRYEDLNRNTADVLNRVSDFFELNMDDELVTALAGTKIRKHSDLKQTFDQKLPPLLRDTARKGAVGEWKEIFTEAHKHRFKELAGDLLVDLGYEKDTDW